MNSHSWWRIFAQEISRDACARAVVRRFGSCGDRAAVTPAIDTSRQHHLWHGKSRLRRWSGTDELCGSITYLGVSAAQSIEILILKLKSQKPWNHFVPQFGQWPLDRGGDGAWHWFSSTWYFGQITTCLDRTFCFYGLMTDAAPNNAPFLGVWALITDLGQVTVRLCPA